MARTRTLLVVVGVLALQGLSCFGARRKKAKIIPDKYLEQFGYLASHGAAGSSHSPKDRVEAIKHFQRFANLPATGNLDKRTIRKMQQRRCGVKDVYEVDPLKPSAYLATQYNWENKVVTWKVVGYTRQLSKNDQLKSFRDAFKHWSNVTNLEFRETTGRADIEIKYAKYQHGDSYSFDGESGTLAHAFFPGSNTISGDTHFDDDEVWTVRVQKGTNLEVVATHEFGHALGLSHSNVPKAVMAPFYAGYSPNFKLHQDDIRGIQSIYGQKVVPTAPPTRRPTHKVTRAPPPTRRPAHKVTIAPPPRPRPGRCSIKFGAVIHGPNGKTYVFRKGLIYELDNEGLTPGFPKNLHDVFPNAPINPAAAVSFWNRYQRTWTTILFKGKRVWRYSGFTLDRYYPKKIRSFNFKSPKAAIRMRGYIFLFRGDDFWSWNERSLQTYSGYPKNSRRYWPDIPKNVGAALMHDGDIYFFKGKKYYKMNALTNRVVKGYPKWTGRSWIGCGKTLLPK